MSCYSSSNPNQHGLEKAIPDPWETNTSVLDTTLKAPPEFIRKIEAQIKHDSEHLFSSATPAVPQIVAPH